MKNLIILIVLSFVFAACSNSNASKETNNENTSVTKSESANQLDSKEPVSPYYLTLKLPENKKLIELKETDLQYNYSMQYLNATNKNELTTKFKINKSQHINFTLYLPGELPKELNQLIDTCTYDIKYVTRDFNKPGISGITTPMATSHITGYSPKCIINKVEAMGKKTSRSGTTEQWYKLSGSFEGKMADTKGTVKEIKNGKFAVVIRS